MRIAGPLPRTVTRIYISEVRTNTGRRYPEPMTAVDVHPESRINTETKWYRREELANAAAIYHSYRLFPDEPNIVDVTYAVVGY